MILGNFSHQNRNCWRDWGIAFSNPHAQFKAVAINGFYCGDHLVANETRKSSFSNGTRPPESWWLAPDAGGLSAINALTGAGAAGGTGQLGKDADADLTGSGGISSAAGGLIVSLLATLTGSGGISAADLKAFLQAVAALTGSGGISSATATARGALVAALTGSGTSTGSTATATGALSADLVVTGTGLTTANVGQAVWAKVIEAGFTAEQILRILAAVNAGDATGLESGNPSFTGLDGATERVAGTYAAGTRTIDTVDGD